MRGTLPAETFDAAWAALGDARDPEWIELAFSVDAIALCKILRRYHTARKRAKAWSRYLRRERA